MRISSSTASPSFALDLPVRDTSFLSSDSINVTQHRRPRRETASVTGLDRDSPKEVVLDEDVPTLFHSKVIKAKYGAAGSDYVRGYNQPSSIDLPGYTASLSDTALMKLALDNQLSPEQIGALQRVSEQRVIKGAQNNVMLYNSVMTKPGVTTTPNPQSYYLSMINQLAGGECAGFSHLHSLAIAEGKHQVFLGNIFQATADPDAPESQAFFHKLAQVQGAMKDRAIAHDPATVAVAAYTSIAPQLTGSSTTKTLLISSEGHRLTAGVIVAPDNKRTYYYSDPNIGSTWFSSAELFAEGMKKIFTDSRLAYLTQPLTADSIATIGGDSDRASTLSAHSAGEPKYLISVFNPDHIPGTSGASNDIKYTYNAPLGGLDSVNVINASRLPTSEMLRLESASPVNDALNDYNRVALALDQLHAKKGIAQFHQATAVLSDVKKFIVEHPNASVFSAMRALGQKLANVINEAAAPVDYPYIFERMELDRVKLAEDKLGSQKHSKTEVIQGKSVDVKNSDNATPEMIKALAGAVNAALQKLSQSDPAAFAALGEKIKVVIANPGDQAQTQLRLGAPPTLIMGDDFFAPLAASDATVADRIGLQGLATADNQSARKQAALIAGKLGMVSYYKAHSTAFLTMANNHEPFRGDGSHLSARATRTSRDFVEEAFTARLYDATLDSRVETSIRNFLPLPAVGQAPVTPPTTAVVPIDQAEVSRLQILDAAGPAVRIGEVEVSRVELYKMGAQIDGKPIEGAMANDSDGRKLANAVQIDYARFAAYRKSASSDVVDRMANIVAEFAANRNIAAAPLISHADGGRVPDALQKNLVEITQHAAALQALESIGKPLPADFFSAESSGKAGATTAAGLGFRAFSTYQGLRSGIESLEQGDTTAAAIGLGAVAADFVGEGAEYALNRAAQEIISSNAASLAGFKTSSVGKMIGKASAGAGAVFSVPFDVYAAIDSFAKADRTTGKEAQDHYVDGAFAVTNAVTSIALSAAFMSRNGASSRVALTVAGTLMSAQAIYKAVRNVEAIESHTSLTDQQKVSVGLRSFLGIEPGFDVMKPYLEAKYAKANEETNRARYESFLQGPGKQYFERVVYGSTDVEAIRVPGSVSLTPSLWYSPITWLLNLIPAPGLVTEVVATGGDDHISSKLTSWNTKPVNTVEGEQGESKATFWDLGEGRDWVVGVEKKPNYFVMGGGKKGITGGDADDKVVFAADARQSLEQATLVSQVPGQDANPHRTALNGGGGRNTLIFTGPLVTTYKDNGRDAEARYVGHDVNLKTNTISIRTPVPMANRDLMAGVKKIAHAQAFSNVTTVEKGQSVIHGNDQNNLFTLNGLNDTVFTGQGANVMVINGGAVVVGEGGFNTYMINQGNQTYSNVEISDPANSLVRLDYSAAQVSGWWINPEQVRSGRRTPERLIITLTGDTHAQTRILLINDAFSNDAQGDKGRMTFITNDGVMITVSAPRTAGSSERVVQLSSVKVEAGRPQA
ncbi:hypothetical protein [Pseudomonas kitaguniensis]|uniref:hypothetical protein n=1 Tax=Pseudomonas kitaguniensis TaxID=2607908 RepID=UPI003BA059B6